MSDIFSHPIPAVIVLLGVLVFVHEFGHFIVGRWAGIAVKRFSIGFGPPIFGFTRKGTQFLVSWIPLGGYVEFAGARPGDKVPEGLDGIPFHEASRTRRALAIAAGPAANIVLAVVVYTVLGMAGIPHPPAEIGMVINDSPAEQAGFHYGDRVIKIGEHDIQNWRDLEKAISSSPGKALSIEVMRDGQKTNLTLTPAVVKAENIIGKEVEIGRAGVALGRVPALLTVTDQDGIAARAGIRTGDRVESLSFDKKNIPIQYYPQLEGELKKAAAAGADHIAMTVRRAEDPRAAGDEGDIASSPAEQEEGPVHPSRNVTMEMPTGGEASFLDRLGLSHSMLTVGVATKTLKGILRAGDQIVSFKGEPLRHYFHFEELLRANKDERVQIGVRRSGKITEVSVPLYGVDVQMPEGKVTAYTFPVVFWGTPEIPDPVLEQYKNPLMALRFGVEHTTIQSGALAGLVWHLIKGDLPLKSLGGPIAMGNEASRAASRGWKVFLSSMALLSINLAVINMFPIPVLDGGQLVLIGAEAIRRRPLRPSAVENFQKIGVAMILALFVLTTYNDISRFWKSMLEGVVGIFQ